MMRRVLVAMGVGVSLASFGCVDVIPIEDAAPPAPQESEQERIARVCRDASAPRCGAVLDEVSGLEVACGQTCSFGQRCLATRCAPPLTILMEPEGRGPLPPTLPWDVASSQRAADAPEDANVQVIWASAPPEALLDAPQRGDGEVAPEDPELGKIYSYVISEQGALIEQTIAATAPDPARRVGDGFGYAIVSDARWLVVSAPGVDWDVATPTRAPVYLYAHDASRPGRVVYNGYVEIDAEPGARCGSALALYEGRLVIGCPGRASGEGREGVLGSVWTANLANVASSKLIAKQLPVPGADRDREGLGAQVALDHLHTLASAEAGAVMWYDDGEPRVIAGQVNGVGFWSAAALGPVAGSGALLYGGGFDEICNPVALMQSCLYCYHLTDANTLGSSQCDFGAMPNQALRMHMIGPRAATFLAREDILIAYSVDSLAGLHLNWIAREETGARRWRDETFVLASLSQLPAMNDRVRFALNPSSLVVSVWTSGRPQDRRLLVLGRPGLETPPLVGATAP